MSEPFEDGTFETAIEVSFDAYGCPAYIYYRRPVSRGLNGPEGYGDTCDFDLVDINLVRHRPLDLS